MRACLKCQLTLPVNMSYMSAPRLHQSTALPWPLRVKISGALREKTMQSDLESPKWPYWGLLEKCMKQEIIYDFLFVPTYIYSIVPQNVWVNLSSNTASLHKPKSVNMTCPVKRDNSQNTVKPLSSGHPSQNW